MKKRSRPKQPQGCRLPGGMRAPLLIYSKEGNPLWESKYLTGRKTDARAVNNRRACRAESRNEMMPVSEERVTGPQGLPSCTHRREPSIHRNTLPTGGQLIASAADIGFNICILIYLTSAEHPKKIFKYRMGDPAAF